MNTRSAATGEQDGGDGEDDPGALHVDAERADVARAVGLAAERLERAAHAEEEAEGEVGDDGEADGAGGELQVAEAAGEELRGGVDAVEAEDVEGDGRRDKPQALRLAHERLPDIRAAYGRFDVVVLLPIPDDRRHGRRLLGQQRRFHGRLTTDRPCSTPTVLR